jgi:putative mRNA 3-end processing factor
MIEYISSSLYIKDSVLWLDAINKKELSFVSHIDKLIVPHTRIIATKETIAFYKKFFLKGEPLNALQMSFFRKFSIGGLTITLFPSGYSFGSSQILVKKDNKKILYSGSINNHQLPFCDEIYYPSADYLIMESTYGNSKYDFSNYKEEEERVKNYVARELQKGNNVVIFVSPLAKPQYIISLFNEFTAPIYLQSKIYQYINYLKDYNLEIKPVRSFVTSINRPSIILYPRDSYNKFPEFSDNIKRIMLTGEAVDKDEFNSIYNLDESFTLSSHADFKSLIQYAEIVKPSKIYLLPSSNNNGELIEELKGKKFNVEAFSNPIIKKLF